MTACDVRADARSSFERLRNCPAYASVASMAAVLQGLAGEARGLPGAADAVALIGKAFRRAVLSRPKGAQVKKILELICCILHPIAVFLIWITVWFNKNLNTGQKIVWAIVSIVPFVPFVYVLTGNDFL